MYTLLAWLPGSENFVATDPAGVMGFLTPSGFQPQGPWLLESATEKYWYEPLPSAVKASSAQASQMAVELQAAEEAA